MGKLRIAYVGNFAPEYSTENDVRKAIELLGHELIQLQEGDQYNPQKASITRIKEEALKSNLLLWTGTWGDAYSLESVLDIVHECAIKGIPTATLHLDTFWSTGRGGRKWWLEPMFHMSHIFTADGDYQDKWALLGKKHTWLPPAVRHDAVYIGEYRQEYECDLAFVGSNGIGYHEDVWGYRKALVDYLRKFASDNQLTFKNPGGDQPKINRDSNMNDFYASARITVGDSLCLKKEDSHYWSDRVPECTGRGGFLIMPKIKALDEYWQIPQYQWDDFDSLGKLIMQYLKDDRARKNIVKQNLELTKSNHTYVNRVQTILEMVGL